MSASFRLEDSVGLNGAGRDISISIRPAYFTSEIVSGGETLLLVKEDFRGDTVRLY